MRVLFLTSSDHPQVRLEAEALGKAFEVDYVPVILKPSQLGEALTSLFTNVPILFCILARLRVPPVPVRSFLINLLLASFIINKKMLRKKQYDVIYAHWLFPAGLIGVMLSKIMNCRLVSVIWGYDIQAMSAIREYGIKDWKRVLSKYVIRKSDMVIANHKVHAQIAVSLAGTRCNGKILYLPPAIPDLTKMPVQEDLLPSSLMSMKDEMPDRKIVLYSPALISYYGLIDLIEAIPSIVSRMNNVLFLIAGEGELGDEAIGLAREEKILDKVLFLGKVRHDVMLNLYRLSEVVCDLCYFGQGTTTLEALCFGKPVIGIASGKRLIDHGKSGFLIKSGDYKTLALYISRLLIDDRLREKMSRNARESFERSFTMDSRVRTLTRIFNSLV